MCTSLTEGGKRCIYSDILSNVRHKARYKHRDLSPRMQQREVNKAVTAWKHANPSVVTAHLPATQPFQTKPNSKAVPQEIIQLLTPKQTPIKGLSEEDRIKATKDLHQEYESWDESLTLPEQQATGGYVINSYVLINAILRRNGVSEIAKKDGPMDEEMMSFRKRDIKALDSALKKAEHSVEVRKVYRFFKIPAGVTVKQYTEKYFQKGEAFKDKGYLSTSIDPEFITATIKGKKQRNSKDRYIMLEILTKQGASLQTKSSGRVGDIQSLEKEVLLPRNTKMRIVDVRSRQKVVFGSTRKDLQKQFGSRERYIGDDIESDFDEGSEMSVPLIQLVDEKLISQS